MLAALLTEGARPTLSDQITVAGSAGQATMAPIWKTLPDGSRYLSSIIVTGARKSAAGG